MFQEAIKSYQNFQIEMQNLQKLDFVLIREERKKLIWISVDAVHRKISFVRVNSGEGKTNLETQ